ncbi:MAG: hypothetical protein ACQEXJ_21025 [Myxococcota bacterium]
MAYKMVRKMDPVLKDLTPRQVEMVLKALSEGRRVAVPGEDDQWITLAPTHRRGRSARTSNASRTADSKGERVARSEG